MKYTFSQQNKEQRKMWKDREKKKMRRNVTQFVI